MTSWHQHHIGRGSRHQFGVRESQHPRLEYESKVYKTLAGGISASFVHWFSTECDYNVIVIDLLGPCLEDLFNFCNWMFYLKTLLLLAGQLMHRC